MKSVGLTPAKAALIGVLLVVFAAVWGPQLIGTRDRAGVAKEDSPPREAVRQSRTEQRTTTEAPAPVAEAPREAERIAPVISLGDVAGFDPFAAPSWSPEARRGNSASLAEAERKPMADRFDGLRRSGVAMILVSGDSRAAQIGDRTLTVGDEVDGFRVVKIEASGVVFEPVDGTEGGDVGP